LTIKRKVLAMRENKERLDVLFIDYLQLLRDEGTLEGTSADMQALSRELDHPPLFGQYHKLVFRAS